MKAKTYFFLLAAFLLSTSGFSQSLNFNFHSIGIEEGLGSLNVFQIQQTSNRLIYVTTENGVFSYNGYNFNLIKSDTLNNPTVLGSYVTDSSSVYLSTRELGLLLLNTSNGQLTDIIPEDKNITADKLCIHNGYVYLLTSQVRLDIIDLNTKKFIHDEIKLKDKTNQAYCLFKTSKNQILCGRKDGVYELKGAKFHKLNHYPSIPVHSVSEDKNGNIILGTSTKIMIYDSENALIQEINPKYKNSAYTFSSGGEKPIDNVISDKYGRIWFTSYPNEHVYLYQNNTTYDIFSELRITPLLINQLFKDKDDNIWIGTFDDGIYFLQNSFFQHVSLSPGNKLLNINKVLFKDDLILTATNNGFYAYDLTENQYKTISTPDEILTEPVFDIKLSDKGAYFSKRSQFDLSTKHLTSNKRSYIFQPVLGKLMYPINKTESILCDWQANVLLTNTEGTKVYDTLISFPDYRLHITSMYKSNDSLLIGSNKGLYYYNFKEKKNRDLNQKTNQKVNDIIKIDGKLAILYDNEIWFPNSNTHINKFGSKPISGLKKIEFRNGYYWIINSDGLYLCDKNFNPVKVINKQNGLLSNFISDISFNDKHVCLSTSKGISFARIDDLINLNSTLDKISIERIRVNQTIINNYPSILHLKGDENNVTIFFNSPVYTQPNKQFFRYKLDNLNWENIENTALNIPALEGGKHNIIIEASTDNINWSEPQLISINKEAKFSETPYSFWAIIIGIIIGVSFISYLIVKRVKQRALLKIKEEQQVNLLKHQAMNALLSPHFIFNSLTSIQNYINSNNALKASEYLAKFSRLIRMIIEKASQQQILLRDEITRLSYYLELEKERFKNKFDYVIHVDDKINQDEIKIPNMIIQPHAENCIIHGILPKMEHGLLTINFNLITEHMLRITLEDDGIGLIKAKENSKTGHKSLGTSTIKSILELNSQLSGKKQSVTMVDKSTIDPKQHGTIINIELEL